MKSIPEQISALAKANRDAHAGIRPKPPEFGEPADDSQRKVADAADRMRAPKLGQTLYQDDLDDAVGDAKRLLSGGKFSHASTEAARKAIKPTKPLRGATATPEPKAATKRPMSELEAFKEGHAMKEYRRRNPSTKAPAPAKATAAKSAPAPRASAPRPRAVRADDVGCPKCRALAGQPCAGLTNEIHMARAEQAASASKRSA